MIMRKVNGHIIKYQPDRNQMNTRPIRESMRKALSYHVYDPQGLWVAAFWDLDHAIAFARNARIWKSITELLKGERQ